MKHNGTILLVEDDTDLNAANLRALQLRKYNVLTALTLQQAREHLTKISPDIILLDVNLPDGNGFDFCAEIRGTTRAHILFLTAKTEHENMVRGLCEGGDDYITKPFHMEELLARVDSAMRRIGFGTSMETLTKGSLVLELLSARVLLHGESIDVTQKEFSILLLLAQNEGTPVSAESIYEKVWAQPLGGDKNAVQTAISKLRAKLTNSGYDIIMKRKQGYVFNKILTCK
jgi:DNA-binding response OmpR family regulator